MKLNFMGRSYSFLQRHYIFILCIAMLYFLMLVFTSHVIGQNRNNLYTTKDFTNPNIISFTAKPYEGKVYFKMLVQDLPDNCLFIIERSNDGVNYEMVLFKEGYCTTPKIPILYCFVDSNATQSTSYYKISKYLFRDCDINKVLKTQFKNQKNSETESSFLYIYEEIEQMKIVIADIFPPGFPNIITKNNEENRTSFFDSNNQNMSKVSLMKSQNYWEFNQ